MKFVRVFSLFSFLVLSYPTQAEVLVLVHGWAADANTWVRSGVQAGLVQHGWQDGGVLVSTPRGINSQLLHPRKARRILIRAQLPAEAPMMIQANHLMAQLKFIKTKYPHQKIILVAHSAGGIVSRLVLVNPAAPKVNMLITIATPNLGTHRAMDALEIADGKPFFCPGPGIDFLKTVVGGSQYQYLKNSRAALVDLMPAGYSRLLGWLNQQVHPDIKYHSVIKQESGQAEAVVPAFSQDLNQVVSLKGKVHVHLVFSEHGLNPGDAILINKILK